MVILRCFTSLNLNWIKSYYMNHKRLCFSILEEKKTENLSFKNRPFWTICGNFFGNYIDIFHNTEIPTVILRCIVCRNLNWIKILVKICIFSCLKIHNFKGILPKCVLTPQKETSSCVLKMAIFSKFFLTFISHIIR